MGQTLEDDNDVSTVKTRKRRGAMSEGSGKKESPIVTNVLNLVGKGAKGGVKGGSAPGKEVSRKSKRTAESQRQYWNQRITDKVVAINGDIQVLEMLPGTQSAVTQWKARLETAQLPQKQGKWQDSHKLVAALQIELRKSVAEQSHQKLIDLKSSAKQRKEYEKLTAELVELRGRLADYPSGGEVETALKRDAEYAEFYYGLDQFGPALESIKKAHQTAKSGLQNFDGQDTDAKRIGSPFKDLSGKLETLEKLIGEKAEIVGDSVVDPFHNDAQAIYKEMLAALEGGVGLPLSKKRDQQNNKNKELLSRAESVRTDLVKAVSKAEGEYKGALSLANTLQIRVADAGEVQPASTVQAAYQALQTMRNQIGARDYPGALKTGVELGEEIRGWPTLPTAGDERFAAVQKVARAEFLNPARTQLERAKGLVKDGAKAAVLRTPPTAASTVEMLETEIEKYEGDTAAYPVGEGIDTVARAKRDNDANDQRKAGYLKLTRTRTALSGQLAQILVMIEKRLDGLKKTLSKGGGDIARLPAYEDVRDAAMAQWDTEAESATEEKQLPFAAVKARLDGLLEQIAQDAKDPAALKDRGVEGRLATLTSAFEMANKTAGDAIETLTETSYEEGDAQRGTLVAARERFFAAMKKRDAATAQKAIEEIDGIATSATDAITTAGKALEKAKKEWYEQSTIANDAFRLLGERVKGKKLAGYAGVLKTMVAEKQAMFLVVSESNDASVLSAIVRDLKALKVEIDKLKTVFDKTDAKTTAPGDITIGTLTKRAEVLAKAFGDKLVKKMEPEALAALIAKRQAIADAIGTVKLSDTDQALTDLAQEWADLQKKARDHETAINTFLVDVETTTTSFGESGVAEKFPDYAAAIEKRLKGLTSDANAGNEDKDALAALKKEIADNALHPDTLSAANDKAQIDELTEVVAAKKWAADYAAFQGRLQSLRLVKKGIEDSAKKKSFEAQVKETTDASKAIAKSEGKTPYATMSEQLQALIRNVNNMISYPMGVETHARGQVMETIKDFNAAVTDFHKKIDAMVETMTEEVNDADLPDEQKQAAIQAVTQRVGKEKALLAINTITPMASKMLKAGDDMDAARDAREEAMREVKRLQRMVEGAPLKAIASNNPFEKTLLDDLRNLSARLFDVETNLTISL